jgi:23S rRNA pseudouridine2605 synthase
MIPRISRFLNHLLKPAMADNTMRLAKKIAHAGLCSRREAERWIEAGNVVVNGKKITTPAFTVTEEDIVAVNGQELSNEKEKPLLFRFHKPKGYLCTNHDPQGRPTVFDLIPPDMPRVMLVGRLDFNSEGLLMLTTDGDLAKKMMSPDNGLERTYRVRIHGVLSEGHIQRLESGIKIDGFKYKPAKVAVEPVKDDKRNQWVRLTITEGKNREIRKIFDHFKMPVSRLIRTSYGPFQLDNLSKKALFQVSDKQYEYLLTLLK